MYLSRSVYKRSTNNLDLKYISEEGFLFLTDRSDFWRNQKPIYVTKEEKETNAKSKKKIAASVGAKKRIQSAAVKQPSRAKSTPSGSKQPSRAKSAPSGTKRQEPKY